MSLLYNGTPISKVSYNGTDLSSLTYNGNELIEDIDYTHFYLFAQKASDTVEGVQLGFDTATTSGKNGVYSWCGFTAKGSGVPTGLSSALTDGRYVYRAFDRTSGSMRTNKSGAWAQLKFPFEVEFKSVSIGSGSSGHGIKGATIKIGYYSDVDSGSGTSFTYTNGTGVTSKNLDFTGNIRGDTLKLTVNSTQASSSGQNTGYGYLEINYIVIHFFARRSDIVNWQNQYGLTFKQHEVT